MYVDDESWLTLRVRVSDSTVRRISRYPVVKFETTSTRSLPLSNPMAGLAQNTGTLFGTPGLSALHMASTVVYSVSFIRSIVHDLHRNLFSPLSSRSCDSHHSGCNEEG